MAENRSSAVTGVIAKKTVFASDKDASQEALEIADESPEGQAQLEMEGEVGQVITFRDPTANQDMRGDEDMDQDQAVAMMMSGT